MSQLFVADGFSATAMGLQARVPVVAGTTSYRVGINSFRFGMGRSESP